MINIQAYEVARDLKGRRTIKTSGLILKRKWPNDFDFGFNIMNPEEWRTWLSKQSLPRTSRSGNQIVYRVYMWGCPSGMIRPGGTKPTVYNLFPGYDAVTFQSKKIVDFGGLK